MAYVLLAFDEMSDSPQPFRTYAEALDAGESYGEAYDVERVGNGSRSYGYRVVVASDFRPSQPTLPNVRRASGFGENWLPVSAAH